MGMSKAPGQELLIACCVVLAGEWSGLSLALSSIWPAGPGRLELRAKREACNDESRQQAAGGRRAVDDPCSDDSITRYSGDCGCGADERCSEGYWTAMRHARQQ